MNNTIATAPFTLSSQDTKLHREIRWICQTLRFAAPAFVVWVLYLIARNWSDVAVVNRGYGRFLQADLSAITPWQRAAAFSVEFVVWLFAAYACYGIWRLFTLYLSGEVLTPHAALWLRRIALSGVVSELTGIATRPLLSVIATLHLPADQNLRIVNIYFMPTDVALLLVFFVLLALAHIQRCAAEIADEHAQFV